MSLAPSSGRLRPVVLAYATSGISKVATAVVQLVALPVVASSLGVERFGAMMTLGAVASLCAIPAQGLSPAASYWLSAARGRGDRPGLSTAFWSIFLGGVGVAAVVCAAGLAVALLADPSVLLGKDGVGLSDELRQGLFAVSAHVFLLYGFSMADGARSAYAENHHTNLFAFVASLAVLAACLVVSATGGSLPMFYFAVYGIPPLGQAANLVAFTVRHRRSLGRPRLDAEIMRAILARSMRYGVAQAGFVMHLHGTLYFVSRLVSYEAAAIVGAANRLFALTQNSLVSFATPVLPLITRSLASGDRGDASRILRIVLSVTVVVPCVLGSAFAVLGSRLLVAWLGPEFDASLPLTAALGLFFVGYSATHLAYLALVSLDRTGRTHAFYVLSGMLALTIDFLFLRGAPVAVVVAASACAMLAINGFVSGRSLVDVLRKLRARDAL